MIDHRFYTDSSGERIKLRPLFEACPLCSAAHPDAKLGVLREDARTETVMCSHCDYLLTRPRRDPLDRRMNGGLRDV